MLYLICSIVLVVIFFVINIVNIYVTRENKVVKNKIKKERKTLGENIMKKIMKIVVSWILSKIYAVKQVEASVAGFRTIVPVANTRTVVMVEALESLNIPFEMELFAFATCKRIFKINLHNKIHKLMKKLKIQMKALKRATLKKEKKIIKKNIKMLKKAIEKLNKHYKKIRTINHIKWFLEIIGNEKGGTMLPALLNNIILKKDSKIISMNPEKQDKKYPEKIRYVIIFHPYIENDTTYHSIDIVDVNKLKIEVDKVEGAANWLDEFYHKLPTISDINNKPYMKYLYNTSEYGVKILDDTIKYSSEDEYNVKMKKDGKTIVKTYSKGKLIALALAKAANIGKENHVPALELGPQKVIFYSKKNEIENILKDINLYDEYLKLGVPQKKMQRLHKIFAPLTKLPVAKVLTGKEYDKYEGIIFVSESYAKKARLVEGAKMAFTLKSLVHIVPDYELLKDNIFYDVAIGDDENKWKLSPEKLSNILHAFTNKIPSVNARIKKVMKLNENAMCNVNMTNNLSETDKELFTALKEIKKHHTNIDKISTEDKKSFLVKFEKILVDILGIEYFNTNNKDTSKIIYFNDRACEILNKVYKKYTETGVKDGKLYHKEYIRLETGSNEVKLDHNLIKKLGRCVAKYIKKAVSTAKWIGASGTVFPMELKPNDAYPLSWNVTKTEKLEKYINKRIETLLNKLVNYQIYFTKEEYMKKMDIIYSEIAKLTIDLSEAKAYVNKQNAKLKALGISEDMMYVQRHPSVLGVWTELYYSPSTKLFYVDTQLWKTFFGGDFDGDTFTSFYPYHMLHKDMNVLEQKTVDQKTPIRIIDPIDNPKMTYLIDKDIMHTYLIQLPAVLNNKIEENKKIKEIFTEEKKSVNNIYIDWANAYDAQQIVGKLHALVCSTLSFFTKLKLTTKEELEYATYFILKYVQPAIAGLKHEDIASLPILEELIEEMKEIYMKMFPNKDTAQFMYIIVQFVREHQMVYNKVRRFNTIANKNYKVEDCDGDVTYYSDDLYYNYKNLKEITRMTTTYWTKLYNKLINAAKLYEPVMIDTKKPTPPTPNKNIKTSMTAVEKVEVKKTNISITPVNTTGKENKMIKMTPVLSVPEQKTEVGNKKEENTMKKVFFSGSHTIKVLPQKAIEVIQLAKEKGVTVLIGDCYGADELIQKELIGYTNVIVYSMYSKEKVRKNLGGWVVKTIKDKYNINHKVSYSIWQQQKDVAMSNDCTSAIIVWDGMSSGTKANKERVEALGKKVYEINVNSKKPTMSTTPIKIKENTKYDVDILGQYWLQGFTKNKSITVKENIEFSVVENEFVEDMIYKYYEAIQNTIEIINNKAKFYINEGYESVTKNIFVPEEISMLIKQCNIEDFVDQSDFDLHKVITNLQENHINIVSNNKHLAIKEFTVNVKTFAELDDELQDMIYDDRYKISILNIDSKLLTKKLIKYYGSMYIFQIKKENKKYYGGHEMNQKMTPVSSTSEQKVESKVVIYTDGSYNTKNNVGSWAYVILKDGIKVHEASGKTKENFLVSRNIAGECTAVLKALQYCYANNIMNVEIHHDLEGVQKWAKPINGEKRWKANSEIVKIYQKWFDKYTQKINVNFVHVSGHSGETWNDYVDELAGKVSGTH